MHATAMKLFQYVHLPALLLLLLVLFASPVLAAAPDGLGSWADSVMSSSQGLMKNGAAVPAIRSDVTSAVGEAEFTLTDGDFFSLGFGGNIVLGFDNGISNGAVIIESTFPGYPGELAQVEMSEDGVTWVTAGTVLQDGTVNQPETVSCAKFVKIIDISNPEDFGDATADGYDVDGVQATGDPCPIASPTPTPTPSIPTNDTPSTTTTTTTTGGSTTCTAEPITTVPVVLEIRRVSPTSIFVSWGPYAGLNDFVIQYGFQDGNWQFSTNTSGFSTTINDLPANQSIWVRVAARNNCATGPFGGSRFSGGTGGVASTLIPGFPETGNPSIPRLPNTGIAPDSFTKLWSISLVVLLGTTILYMIKRAVTSISK